MFNLSLKELRRFHKDDGGAPELSTVLIVALVAIPLILIVVAVAGYAFVQVNTRQKAVEGTTSTKGTSTAGGKVQGPGVIGKK